jgi:Winged helix-turn helix
MPKKVQLEPHLSVQELYTRYRTSSRLVERSHYQIIWLLASGHTPLAVSQVTGYSRIWIYQLLRRYNQLGAGALSAIDVRPIVGNLLNSTTYKERNCGKSYLGLLPMAVYGMVAKSLIG